MAIWVGHFSMTIPFSERLNWVVFRLTITKLYKITTNSAERKAPENMQPLEELAREGVRRAERLIMEDEYWRSTESWASVLRDPRSRGLPALVLAVRNDNKDFWAALREVCPETQQQGCGEHRIADVLDKLLKRLKPWAKAMPQEITRAIEPLTKDWDQSLRTWNLPAEHWSHLWTINPVDSQLATVKALTKKTKGAGCQVHEWPSEMLQVDASEDRLFAEPSSICAAVEL